MPLRVLEPKPGAPVIDSGDFLTYLQERGVNVDGDTVIAYSDGSVGVETLATTSLQTAWESYGPVAAVPSLSLRDALLSALNDVQTLDELVVLLREVLIPAVVPEA